MKNILVIYSSQTGQMRRILDAMLKDIKDEAVIDFHQIELEKPYPFPWLSYEAFFDAMPETVLGITRSLKPLQIDENKNYDLVILGYQPWFLSPSVPFRSFLESQYAELLKDKPVVTVIGSRNMWLRAQEISKKKLIELNASLVGHIALEDKHPNLASTMSISRWMIKGQKEADAKYPEAGVSNEDILSASKFGTTILDALEKNELNQLQTRLLSQGAICLRPNLIVMESQGAKQFPKWAKRAYQKDAAGRKKVLNLFKRVLIFSIFVLSPISGSLAKLKVSIQKKKTSDDLDYFRSVGYTPNRIAH